MFLLWLLIWVSEGSRNTSPWNKHWTKTGSPVFLEFLQSDFKHLPHRNTGKGKVRSCWQGKRFKMEKGSVTHCPPHLSYTQDKKGHRPTSILGDCLFAHLFISPRVSDSSPGQPKVLPGSSNLTVINTRQGLEMFSTQAEWISAKETSSKGQADKENWFPTWFYLDSWDICRHGQITFEVIILSITSTIERTPQSHEGTLKCI